MHPLEMVKKEIAGTTISDTDQQKFVWFLERMPERYLIDILDMSREDENFLEFLWSNYSKKDQAFKTGDQTLIDDVLREEKNMLDQMNHE